MLTVAAPASSAVSANSTGSFMVEVRGHSLPEPPLPSGRWRLRMGGVRVGVGTGEGSLVAAASLCSWCRCPGSLANFTARRPSAQPSVLLRGRLNPGLYAPVTCDLHAASFLPLPRFSPGCFWEFAWSFTTERRQTSSSSSPHSQSCTLSPPPLRRGQDVPYGDAAWPGSLAERRGWRVSLCMCVSMCAIRESPWAEAMMPPAAGSGAGSSETAGCCSSSPPARLCRLGLRRNFYL